MNELPGNPDLPPGVETWYVEHYGLHSRTCSNCHKFCPVNFLDEDGLCPRCQNDDDWREER